MSTTKFMKLKRRNLVYYSLADEKRYNEKSKENLKQFENNITDEQKKELAKLKNVDDVECINDYSKSFLLKYSEIKKKDYKRNFSITQQKKITDSTNTFIDVIKHNYKKSNGFNQRMITFVTLTIPENQKHTDKVMVKTLIDFIDHLKKVKNTLVQNKVDTGHEILRLKNYVWRAETTEKGNIHFHLLFDCYVNHVTMKRVWNGYLENLGYEGGENGANIHNLKNIDDVGSYVTKYMTKEPLNDEFTELLKSKQIKHSDLEDYSPDVKYRRPILYTSWGCSRSLKKLTAPTFCGNEIFDFAELRNKCELVELPEDLKDYVKIYKGKIYDLLNKCSFLLKRKVKNKFNDLYKWLYDKTEEQRNDLDKLIWLHRQSFQPQNIFDNIITERKVKPYMPQLF
ncbi:rolling circle replication-associated protein [Kaistella sp.]|uniref:rolling circle replication-associated protein n=1 Tax=Kaistella sp. TaxID=2782235 RepID=UPI003C534D7C